MKKWLSSVMIRTAFYAIWKQYPLEVFMSKKHTILMLLCCVVGMGAAAAIFFFGIPVNRVFTTLLILLCPLSHLFMMKFMMKGHGHGTNDQQTHDSQLIHEGQQFLEGHVVQ